MSSQTAAKFLLQALGQAGIKRIYGIAGDSLNALTEAVREDKNFEWIHVRHEEVAAFAAGAEAHLTGTLAVCAGSCGPGNLHLINGLYDCHKSRVPVLAIAAQIPSAEIGTNYFQETNPEKIFEGCSHYCGIVSDPSQLPRILKIAIETSLSCKGVSVIVLSGDIALRELNVPVQGFSAPARGSYMRPDDGQIRQLSQALNEAKKVTILAGAGCAGAHDELIKIAEKLKAPVVHTLRSKEYVEYNNAYDVGLTGLIGFSSGYFAMESCDLLLMLGTDFPYTQFYPKTKIIQIDARGENIGRRTRVDLGVVGDVKKTLELLLGSLRQKEDQDHLIQARKHYAKARAGLDELAVPGSIRSLVHPQYVVKLLDELSTDDAVFSCDVGTPTVWAARYLKMNGKRRLLGSFNHGSMANALPQAIGAQVAFPQRQVISLSGDGGFTMLMGDFLTLTQHNLPVKTIIFNNSSLGFVELEMKAAGFLETATSLKNPNFAKLAQAVGVQGFRVERPIDLEPALRKALGSDGPALVDVVVSRNELTVPPHITAEQVHGFGLFALKVILSGKGSELIDLAKVNLWR
ncbi:MAG: ubiquinone-dependent pyruvate dehydrogenase [Candidatus Omnitrophica bacterium]|nr:ubiquinone-dependent pyruvate dehydrogenase [Candidatus Omnitrophota bacterium]MDE2009866.1 ubiquinone-dependent pyruvate dehydrogenase [Candidatus Omnitrophota bacterium]MDE2214352.1 ubiquinone-dependent pyruvate dehydrogenase [Candidatus Omnitrophota bacterium]MDE2231101.1 ubiquinone-dependent pyruvate dehydrogenase [Candidatus Omnitrophota bacterium]